jgi:hypothetical protein
MLNRKARDIYRRRTATGACLGYDAGPAGHILTDDCGGDVHPAQHNGAARCRRTCTGPDLVKINIAQGKTT